MADKPSARFALLVSTSDRLDDDADRASLDRARGRPPRDSIVPFHSRDREDAARPRDKFPSCRRDRGRRGDANYLSTRKREARKTKHALACFSLQILAHPFHFPSRCPAKLSALARSLAANPHRRCGFLPRIEPTSDRPFPDLSTDSRSTETNPGRNMIVNVIDIVRTTIRVSRMLPWLPFMRPAICVATSIVANYRFKSRGRRKRAFDPLRIADRRTRRFVLVLYIV